MKRRRFLDSLTATLLAVTMIGGGFALAAPPEGKGGGKDGGSGDDPTSSPPTTYIINWIDDFGAVRLNNAGDLIGEIPSLAGTGTYSRTYGLTYGSELYVLDSFFVGTGATPRVLMDLSNRRDDGSIYLCGSCDTADGVRGWRMKLSPSTDGLERVSFSILQPVAGDEISALKSINIHGESVGYSYSKADYLYASIYQSDIGTLEIGPLGDVNSYIADSGEVIAVLVDAQGARYIGSWVPGGPIQTLLHASDVNAVSVYLLAVNEVGEFLVNAIEQKETNVGTYQTHVTYFYDGTPHYLTDTYADPRPYYEDLNIFGDLISQYYISGKGNKPGRYVNEVYFAGLGIAEDLGNMIDEANLQGDVDRWFGTKPRAVAINDLGLVVGQNDFGATFFLVPVEP